MRAIDRARFVAYDTSEYPFAEVVAAEIFGISSLSLLPHCNWPGRGDLTLSQRNMAMRSHLAAKAAGTSLMALYRRLVAEVVAPLFGGRISYTAKPTFRVQLPASPSISKWHTDVSVTGRTDQIGAWVPFTDAFDTAALWVESDYGLGDYGPVGVAYGEILLFDGGLLRHGSVPNTTAGTRVSMDFRFAPLPPLAPAHDLGILGGRAAGLQPVR